MELKNKTLYHFRDGRRKNPNWMIGSEFVIDDKYKNHACSKIKRIDSGLPDVEKKIAYYKMLKDMESPFNIGERMLELYREEQCPRTVGRINCMFFCDEESLEYWSHKFGPCPELYEVEVNGTAFKTSSILFPFAGSNCTYEEFLQLCESYWKPDLTDEELNSYAEYLFQGTVFVREKLDIEQVRSKYKKQE